MPHGVRRRSRRPAMPVTSVTASRPSRDSSSARPRTATAPNGLPVSEISLAKVRVRAIPTVTGTPTRSMIASRIVAAYRAGSIPRGGVASKKNSSIE